MRMWAIFVPPVAMVLAGKPVQALIAAGLMLTILGWPVASIWAWGIVSDRNADRRIERATERQLEAQRKAEEARARAAERAAKRAGR